MRTDKILFAASIALLFAACGDGGGGGSGGAATTAPRKGAPYPPAPPTAAPPVPPPPTPPVPSPPVRRPEDPAAAIEPAEHDFGAVKQNAKVETTFMLRNAGGATLHVLEVTGGCGCIQASADAKEVAPGKATTVRVAYETRAFVGRHEKWVQVRTDDPATPTVAVKVVVDVCAGVIAEPANFFWPMALYGTSPEPQVTVKWKEGAGKPFHVTGVEAQGVDATFDVAPWERAPWKGWEVTLRFKKPPEIGNVSAHAVIRTDDPETPSVKTLVGGAVSGKVWLPQREVSFGVVAEGKGATLKVPLQGFDKSVDLGEVTARATKGRVTATAERVPGEPGAWTVVILLPPRAPPGSVEDRVEVTTAVPGETSLSIAVSGSVVR